MMEEEDVLLRLPVEARHIEQGQALHGANCPVQRALFEFFPDYVVSVGVGVVLLTGPTISVTGVPSRATTVWIGAFDGGSELITPFTAEIRFTALVWRALGLVVPDSHIVQLPADRLVLA